MPPPPAQPCPRLASLLSHPVAARLCPAFCIMALHQKPDIQACFCRSRLGPSRKPPAASQVHPLCCPRCPLVFSPSPPALASDRPLSPAALRSWLRLGPHAEPTRDQHYTQTSNALYRKRALCPPTAEQALLSPPVHYLDTPDTTLLASHTTQRSGRRSDYPPHHRMRFRTVRTPTIRPLLKNIPSWVDPTMCLRYTRFTSRHQHTSSHPPRIVCRRAHTTPASDELNSKFPPLRYRQPPHDRNRQPRISSSHYCAETTAPSISFYHVSAAFSAFTSSSGAQECTMVCSTPGQTASIGRRQECQCALDGNPLALSNPPHPDQHELICPNRGITGGSGHKPRCTPTPTQPHPVDKRTFPTAPISWPSNTKPIPHAPDRARLAKKPAVIKVPPISRPPLTRQESPLPSHDNPGLHLPLAQRRAGIDAPVARLTPPRSDCQLLTTLPLPMLRTNPGLPPNPRHPRPSRLAGRS